MRIPVLILLAWGQAALAEAPRVITDIAPVQSLVATVMEGVGEPGLLMDQGADPHDFQMRPSQARAVAGADLVVWMGPDLAPWLDRVLDTLGDAALSRVLLDLEPLPMRIEGAAATMEAPEAMFSTAPYDGPTVDLLGGDQHGDHHHGEDHDHAEEDHTKHDHAEDAHAAHDHGHDHGPVDPHAWLDPGNAAAFLRVIAADLAALDPENAVRYAANAAAAIDRLKALHNRLSERLADAHVLPIITSHDAYSYFLVRYGMNPRGSLRDSHAAQPSAARLSQIIADLDGDVAGGCVFLEPGESPDLFEGLGLGPDFHIGIFDPTGATLEPGPALYEALIEGMATAIEGCASALN